MTPWEIALITALFVCSVGLGTISIGEILRRHRTRRTSFMVSPHRVRNEAIVGTSEKLRTLPFGWRLTVTLSDTGVSWIEEPVSLDSRYYSDFYEEEPDDRG